MTQDKMHKILKQMGFTADQAVIVGQLLAEIPAEKRSLLLLALTVQNGANEKVAATWREIAQALIA